MLEMCRMLWSLRLPSDDMKSTTSPFYQHNTLYELRITHQTQQRFNDVEMDTAAHSFTKFYEDIGPRAGQRMLCQLSDGGKTNKNNNRHYSGVLPHRNPLLCAIFARGGLLLHRYIPCLQYMGANICSPSSTCPHYWHVSYVTTWCVHHACLLSGCPKQGTVVSQTGGFRKRCLKCLPSAKQQTKQNLRHTKAWMPASNAYMMRSMWNAQRWCVCCFFMSCSPARYLISLYHVDTDSAALHHVYPLT